MSQSVNESVTEVFVEQPLASPGPAKYLLEHPSLACISQTMTVCLTGNYLRIVLKVAHDRLVSVQLVVSPLVLRY